MSQPASAQSDSSSPQYFVDTFKVSPEQAASLSAQARAADSTRGGGITAEAPARGPVAAPPGVVVAPTPPASPVLNARQAYDQLQADRTAGKVGIAEYRQREQQLAEQIANGQGASPPESTPTPETDPLVAEFAPSKSPSDFVFPNPREGHSDETIAKDAAIKEAFHAEGFAPKLVNLAATMLQQDMPQLEGKSPEQLVDRQLDGLGRMWKGEAEFNANMATWRTVVSGWQRSANPTVREWAAKAPLLNPVVIDQIVAATNLRAARR